MTITLDGHPIQARIGDTVAAALWANGILTLRHEAGGSEPHGLYCGIGHCYECRVMVDSIENVRACLTPVRDGMKISLGR